MHTPPSIRGAGTDHPVPWDRGARGEGAATASPLPDVTSLKGQGQQPQAQYEDVSHPVPLWICAYLHRLPLEVLHLSEDWPTAAVSEDQRGRSLLHAVSESARAQGLMPGMPLPAAYALCPKLSVKIRDLKRERRALHELAERGLSLTPWVSLDFPGALLLEVRGSLALFGGLEKLMAKLRETLAANRHRAYCAVSPSPLASWMLARSGREYLVTIREELRSVLGILSIELLGIDEAVHERLRKTGVSNLRDLWRLPRAGLARRYGLGLVSRLDQAAGDRATPLCNFHAPPRFDAAMALPGETARLAQFFPAVEMLAARLANFVAERHAAVTDFTLTLIHRQGPPTRLLQGSRRPIRDRGQLLMLLQERLERLTLPSPVCVVKLSSSAIVPWTPVAPDLFVERRADPLEWQQLLEHLEARLGSGALRYLSLRSDHRPEYAGQSAWRPREATAAFPAVRPFWLLPEPRALSRDELGAISPEAERIESGWWDGNAVRRDYHRAVDRRGARLWIYRNLKVPMQWYLHGLFG